ncbi:cation/H(+) antiporter 28 [Macadamia integrifolia]|uniref:cation/H(+) antiporter 28 n=1 Tax=Macadamia integrifolia TaxID=60698 RepID=UPI001C4F4340|nr:cation/H(+) antiporter 28 [Macadamia integrifolia]
MEKNPPMLKGVGDEAGPHSCMAGEDPNSRKRVVYNMILYRLFIGSSQCQEPHALVGAVFGHLLPLVPQIPPSVIYTMETFTEIGMIFYLFVLGLEMNIYILFHRPTPEAWLTYAGILSTLIVTSIFIFIPFSEVPVPKKFKYVYSLSIILSNTASPILTRLVTDLKIGKLDIGRVAINAGMHSDMVTTLLISMGLASDSPSSIQVLESFVALGVHLLMVIKLLNPVLDWINDRNPDGKPINSKHLVVVITLVGLVCAWGPLQFVSPSACAFVTGLAIPRDGRVPKMMINKINYFLNALVFPIYFCWVGMHFNFKEYAHRQTWIDLFLVLTIGACGRVIGTLVCSRQSGLNWVASVGLGLLLGTKGHFYIYIVVTSVNAQFLSSEEFMVMVLVPIFSILYVPLVVSFLVKWGNIRDQHRNGLQWLDPSNELRMLLCLNGTQNVPSSINILEVSRGLSGVTVYATDMIEVTDRIVATLGAGERLDGVAVVDEMIVNMREQVTNAISTHITRSGEGMTLHRSLVVTTFGNMHEQICKLAENLQASIIILPFDKNQNENGKMDDGHTGFRRVNRQVLRHALCSVGIFVDRGFGLIDKVTSSYTPPNVAVIFIGGKDDREALAYSKRIAHHPGINLTVIRLLQDTNSVVTSGGTSSSNIRSTTLFHTPELEEEMTLDDECIAEFYESCVADGKVGYTEKYVANSIDTLNVLSTLEGMYTLFIVGRGGRVNKALTTGMNDIDDFPELGSVGGFLTASDSSNMASVLVIQQYSRKREFTNGLDDDDDDDD